MIPKHVPDEVVDLAAEYVSDVRARQALGDKNAAYHAQRPKIDAHKLLLDAGFTAKEVVNTFNEVCASLGTSCTCDAMGDGPCPVHASEMRAQDRRLRMAVSVADTTPLVCDRCGATVVVDTAGIDITTSGWTDVVCQSCGGPMVVLEKGT